MWAFKTLWDKGLVYEGFRVLAYCWRCETPLSNTETRMDDVYRDRQDPALTVWFELDDGDRILIWTTTPWTLPSNLALAVGPDIDYAVMQDADGARYILAESRLDAYAKELGRGRRRSPRSRAPSSSAGATRRCSRSSPTHPNAFQVLAGDFVSTEDGTGVVHMAPGLRRGRPDRLQRRRHPDRSARWTSTAATPPRSPPWAGAARVRRQPARDPRPQGPRRRACATTPTTTRTRTAGAATSRSCTGRSRRGSSRSPTFRDRMVELNQQITLGARARQGGQLRQVAGQRPRLVDQPQPLLGLADPGVEERRPELPAHRRLRLARRPRARLRRRRSTTCTARSSTSSTRPNPDDPTGRSTMRRVTEVLDCWFESGSMPFAQVHYPFENADWFEHHYPGRLHRRVHRPRRAAGSTRMHVLATALFDRPAFSHLREPRHRARRRRPKMSKSPQQLSRPAGDVRRLRRRRHAVDPAVVADPARRRLLGHRDRHPRHRPPRDPAVLERVLLPDAVRQRRRPARRGSAPTRPTCSTATCMGELRGLVDDVTERMDAYDLFGACESVAAFLDTLTNWYIRRSRDRFWAGDQDAIDALHTALVTLVPGGGAAAAAGRPSTCTAGSPATSRAPSVHLTDWPASDAVPVRRRPARRHGRRSATRARRCCRCARRRACACGCRSPRRSSPRPTRR